MIHESPYFAVRAFVCYTVTPILSIHAFPVSFGLALVGAKTFFTAF